MNGHPIDRLSAYLDAELDPAARAEVDRHLASCPGCRAALADLEQIRGAALAWGEATVQPDRDLWTGIAARLSDARQGTATTARIVEFAAAPARTRWYQRRWSVGVPELALAATVMAAVAGGLLWYRPAETPPAVVTEAAPIVAEGEPYVVDAAAVVPVSFADAQYDAAVRDLEQVLQSQRDRLDPRTVIVLERNLRVIDDAIREAREALAADPANTLLNSHLASARRRKLDLLRRAALITEAN
jgi:anti-sigma factor RsiW